MVVAKAVPGPGVRVWVATLVQADLALRGRLDDRERERFERYATDADRARFLLGAAMLRAAAAGVLGTRPSDVAVDRTCLTCGGWHGRPVVPGAAFSLSVAHGGSLVTLALAAAGPVGVDVEPLRARAGRRTRRWTRAEARFKAGDGPGLIVRELVAPLPGHVLSLATCGRAPVQVRPAAELLT